MEREKRLLATERSEKLPPIYKELLSKYYKYQDYLSRNERADLFNHPAAQELRRAGILILEHIHEGRPLEEVRKTLIQEEQEENAAK